jgi:DNA-directed RNA polymerase specialized sigma24 family protein
LSRIVVTLRDVCGFTARDVSCILGLDEVAQRRLLHHGRSGIRAAVEQHYRGAPALRA